MPKITKRLVDRLGTDPTGKDVFHWDAGDGALKGFGIRVKPSGAASFLIQYRNNEGRTRRMVIGRVGTLTPNEARALARTKLTEVAIGSDPSAQRRAARTATNVAELCDLYLTSAQGQIKASTLAMDRSRIETHVKPLIGRLTVRSLSSADIERLKADIIAGRTAAPRRKEGRGGVARGGAGVAARTVGMFSTILEYAIKPLGLIKDNPARGVKKPTDGRQRRFLAMDEIHKLGRAMWNLPSENATAVAALRLLLLTGFRRMETLGLPWAWVDTNARCVRFGDTKSGEQLRPIGVMAAKLLQELPSREVSPWVFPAEAGDGHFVGLPKVLARLCAKAGLDGVTIHVLRHTFAAAAAEMGFSELTIAGLLGHSVPGVTARYAHVPDSALIGAADRVSTRIAAALNGTEQGLNVVPMRMAG
jgi:integrase